MKQAKIILLRHGQCEGGSILRGKTDVSLSDLGFCNMHQSAAKLGLLGYLPFLNIYSSPLIRCRVFADELSQQLNQVDCSLTLKPKLMSELQEIDFGLWDGKGFDELYQHHAAELDAYWDNPWDNALPEAELMADFERRVASAFELITEQLYDATELDDLSELGEQGEQSNQPCAALVVTHGGVMRHIISLVLGVTRCKALYAQFNLDYAATVSIDVFWSETDDKHNKPVYRLNWSS
ncbi:histidine phosphatase family protein [Shewanella donghaensis]|uniref:histidine phosphatase family protein n=1 Tax=Shewanella donghaensis TaxID=238836 RepID=UPI00131546ED|nr:histidine phosphatase family protein [Shewanella donghaensis]